MVTESYYLCRSRPYHVPGGNVSITSRLAALGVLGYYRPKFGQHHLNPSCGTCDGNWKYAGVSAFEDSSLSSSYGGTLAVETSVAANVACLDELLQQRRSTTAFTWQLECFLQTTVANDAWRCWNYLSRVIRQGIYKYINTPTHADLPRYCTMHNLGSHCYPQFRDELTNCRVAYCMLPLSLISMFLSI